MVKVTADSGAADHVAPVHTASHLGVRETEASRQGVKHVAANGHKIANLGQRKIQGVTDTWGPTRHDLASSGSKEATRVGRQDVRCGQCSGIHQGWWACGPGRAHGGSNRYVGKKESLHAEDEEGKWSVQL